MKKIIEELKHLETLKNDFILNHYEFSFLPDGEINFESGMIGNFANLTDNAKDQLFKKLNIPVNFAQYLTTEKINILEYTVNNLKGLKGNERYLFRCLNDGEKITKIRAVLSDRYKRINNLDAITIVLESLEDYKIEIIPVNIDADSIEIIINLPDIFIETENDKLTAGLMVLNNEVGGGVFSVFPRPYSIKYGIPILTNEKRFKRVHLGAKLEDGEVLDKIQIHDIKNEFNLAFKTFLDPEFLQKNILKIIGLSNLKKPFINEIESIFKELKLTPDQMRSIVNGINWTAKADYLYFKICKEIKDLETQSKVYKTLIKYLK